jgi:hypothetical protein
VFRATTATGLGDDIVATAEQEPIAANVVICAATATGIGATVEQEPITAAVVLGAAALEEMDMDMFIEPTNRGLEEATNGLEEEDEHEEQDTTINLIGEEAMVIDLLCVLNESDNDMYDDDVDILEDFCN